MEHDYSAYAEAPKGGDLAKLAELAEELAEIDLEAQALELKLKNARSRADSLRDVQIPELMEELGMEKFTTTNGFEIDIKESIRASISKENEPLAFAWLDQNGHGGMIKRKVEVRFDKNQEDAAKELAKELRSDYSGVSIDGSVHNSTLRSWVRKRLEKGEEIPETISHIVQKSAKIKNKNTVQ